MRNILFLAVSAVLFLTSSTWGSDISGTWTITQKNNEGVEDSFDISIKTAGDNLTITGNHPKIGALSGSGALKGEEIIMTVNAEGAQGKGALSFAYTGKITGNKMSGTKETKMSGTPGGQGSPPGRQGGAPAGSSGQAPAGGGQATAGVPQGAPPGGDGAPAAAGSEVSKAWSAVKK